MFSAPNYCDQTGNKVSPGPRLLIVSAGPGRGLTVRAQSCECGRMESWRSRSSSTSRILMSSRWRTRADSWACRVCRRRRDGRGGTRAWRGWSREICRGRLSWSSRMRRGTGTSSRREGWEGKRRIFRLSGVGCSNACEERRGDGSLMPVPVVCIYSVVSARPGAIAFMHDRHGSSLGCGRLLKVVYGLRHMKRTLTRVWGRYK